MRLPAFIYIFIILAMLTGCGNQQQVKKPEPPVKIAVSLADMERDSNKIVKKVMESRKNKDKADIIWLDAENDQAKQAEQLQKVAGQNVKVVVLQPVNPITGPDLIRQLAEKNIKIIALETLPEDAPVDAYVASDQELAGKLLGQFVIRTARKAAGMPVEPNSADYETQGQSRQGQGTNILPPESQITGRLPLGVFLISGDPKDNSTRQIATAAKAVIQNSSETQLLGEAVVTNSDLSRIHIILQEAIKEQGDKLQAVIATDSLLAMEAVNYLRTAGLTGRILTAGVGASEKAAEALAKGEHDAEIDTRPDLLGQYALEAAVQLAKEGFWQYSSETENSNYSVPSRITPVRIVEAGNVYLLSERWNKKNEKNNKTSEASGQSSKQESDQKQEPENTSPQGEQSKKTKLRVTTQDGKTMEIEIDGEIKKIESMNEQQQGQENKKGQNDVQQDGEQ